MHRYNGNGRGSHGESHDPKAEDFEGMFPLEEVLTDCAGKLRKFKIEHQEVATGHAVEAREVGAERGGYEFRGYHPTHSDIALGEVRLKMRRELSRKYIERDHGCWCPRLDELRGRITMADGAPAFVIDGHLLTLEEFGQLMCVHEGWEFHVRFDDKVDCRLRTG